MEKTTSMKEGVISCASCDRAMKLAVLKMYTFEEGYPLSHVSSYQCPQCHEIFFTEAQAKLLEQRTEQLKKDTFAFQRKITLSGKSLVVGIPSELAEHLHLKQGTTVKILPLTKDKFLVQKT